MKRNSSTMRAAVICLVMATCGAGALPAAKLPVPPSSIPSAVTMSLKTLQSVADKVIDIFPRLKEDGASAARTRILERLLSELDPSGFSRPAARVSRNAERRPAITVIMRNGVAQVTQVALFSDAWRKDVRPEDIVLAVGDRECLGATLGDIESLLEGKPGETVELRLLRPSQKRVLTVSLLREAPVSRTFSRLFSGKVLYLRPSRIDKSSVDALVKAVPADSSHLIGVILDLRGASGGGVEEARRLCGLFVDGGSAGRLLTAAGAERNIDAIPAPHRIRARSIVLVDAGTGAAGELAAAVLQERRRVVVMGRRTCGLGLEYAEEIVSGVKLLLPAFRSATPSGKNVFARGVHPDIPAELPRVPVRLWKDYRHQFLALLENVKPDELDNPYDKKEDKKDDRKMDIPGGPSGDKDDKSRKAPGEKDGKSGKQEDSRDSGNGEGTMAKSLETLALADYPLVRQYDRPFVRALNLLVSMNVFFKECR